MKERVGITEATLQQPRVPVGGIMGEVIGCATVRKIHWHKMEDKIHMSAFSFIYTLKVNVVFLFTNNEDFVFT